MSAEQDHLINELILKPPEEPDRRYPEMQSPGAIAFLHKVTTYHLDSLFMNNKKRHRT